MSENYQQHKTLNFKIQPGGKVIKLVEALPLWPDGPRRLDPARMRRPSGIMPVPSNPKEIAAQVNAGEVTLEPVVAFFDGRFFWQASDFDRPAIIEHVGYPLAIEATVLHGGEEDARLFAVMSGHALEA